MSNHVPECWCANRPCPRYPGATCPCRECICDELRACEQRAEAGAYNAGYVDGSKDAREGAFYEAREAVAGLQVYDDHGALKPFSPETAVVYMTAALAAIDALRKNP